MKSSYNINKVWNIENLCGSLTNLVITLIEKWTYWFVYEMSADLQL